MVGKTFMGRVFLPPAPAQRLEDEVRWDPKRRPPVKSRNRMLLLGVALLAANTHAASNSTGHLRPRMIHVPKTGGTSVGEWCKPLNSHWIAADPGISYAGNALHDPAQSALLFTRNPLVPTTCNVVWHIPPRWLSGSSDVYTGHRTFCIVRDPIERALSRFKHVHCGRVPVAPLREECNSRLALNKWLAAFLLDRNGTGCSAAHPLSCGSFCHMAEQHLFVFDADGRRRCDVIPYSSDALLQRVESWLRDAGWPRLCPPAANRSFTHLSSTLTVADIDPALFQALRQAYELDYTLLFGGRTCCTNCTDGKCGSDDCRRCE